MMMIVGTIHSNTDNNDQVQEALDRIADEANHQRIQIHSYYNDICDPRSNLINFWPPQSCFWVLFDEQQSFEDTGPNDEMVYRGQVPPLFPYNLIVDTTSYFSQYTGTINIPEAIQIHAIHFDVQANELIGKHYLPIKFHPPNIFHLSGKLNSFVFKVKHNV